ncbi:MAG: Abi family protein [Acutalibacteraceae bacterium]
MNYINELKKQNITFNIFNEQQAITIIKKEYSYYKLMSYSCLFEKYKQTNKEGQFVNLDFSQLYYLALIDSQLSKILMTMCLEIENTIKTIFIFDAEMICDTKTLLHEYYDNENEFIDMNYTADNNDIINEYKNKVSIQELSLNEFLEVIQFGTLERFVHFFYKKYGNVLYCESFYNVEFRLSSIRRIRNIVAHNNSCMSRITEETEYKDVKLLSFLGSRGVKNRSLTTNMSKKFVSDFCGVLDVYFRLVENKNIINDFKEFDINYCLKYKSYFEKNDKILSFYNFAKKVIEIYNSY